MNFAISYGSVDGTTREHLFVSYATEDAPLAEWLTRKLTAEGYRVWCDRFQLLGGESYPRDIDLAIKTRTFRVLAMLSRASIPKANPVKERTLALNIGRERKEDFLIPLNVDGLPPTELDWMTSDLTFISFSQWAPGLRQLLEKLASINAPRPLERGREIAASTFLPSAVLRQQPELLYSNIFRATLPSTLRRFTVSPGIPREERDTVRTTWPFHMVSPTVVLAFDNPSPAAFESRTITLDGTLAWSEMFDINGIRTRDIITALLKASMATKALGLGLRITPNGRAMYFPEGLAPDDKFWFQGYAGKETYVRVTGERTLWRPLNAAKYRYYLAGDIRARSDIPPGYVVQITPTVHVTSPLGEPLLDRTINSRRKHVTKTWTNHHWLNRLFALTEFLAGGTDAIRLGSVPETEVVVSSKPITMAAPIGINEAALDMPEPSEDDEGAGYDHAHFDGDVEDDE